jgi:hypothetical protein
MLSAFDDYPIHQTPEPIAQPATNDRNAYDRYWFNGIDRGGEFYFGVAFGRYPHLGVVDAALSLVTTDGTQHAFHISGRAPADPSDTRLGPFRLEVVEPMLVTHITLDDNETGVTADLTFTAKTACVEEGRQIWQPGSRRTLDNTRFAQYGNWSGHITFEGQTLEVNADSTTGVKDRSWGIRPVGEADPAGAPVTDFAGFWFLWNPMHWDDHCSHIGLFLEPDARPWHTDAAIVPAYGAVDAVPGVSDPGTKHFHHVTQDIDWLPGTRWARFAELTMSAHDGTTKEIELEPVLRFHMKGIGYRHPEWNHGCWKGELAMASELWKTADLDPLAVENLHVQQVVMGKSGTQNGVGALEQLVIGANVAGNFTDLLDGAR